MTRQQIGILHPGEMGISVAAAARRAGQTVHWASEGRSPTTRARAERFGLEDARTVEQLCARCEIILSVCPPHAAEEVATEVAGYGFQGLYLDANAVSPTRTLRIGEAVMEAGASFVDGGIIGGPAWESGRTWLYLAGSRAEEIAECFSAGPLETRVLGGEPGVASALKMCYAAQTKGTTALLCALLAAAERLGVREALEEQWDREEPGSSERAAGKVRGVTAKAWRFSGEMEEISSTFRDAGVPGEFHTAAAEIYRRLAGFKNSAAPPALEEVLAALLQREK